jgi:hypothetical protein
MTVRINISPGILVRNNTGLQRALEMLMGIGNISRDIEILVNISASIGEHLAGTRNFNVSGSHSRITTQLKYTGEKNLTKFLIFERIPKNFAASASEVIVTAEEADVQVVEIDPSWAISYTEIKNGDEIKITYDISSSKSYSVIYDMHSEVYGEYADSGAAPARGHTCVPGYRRCNENFIEVCNARGDGWDVAEICEGACDAMTTSCKKVPAKIEEAVFVDFMSKFMIVALFSVVIAGSFAAVIYRNWKKPKTPEIRKKLTTEMMLTHKNEWLFHEIGISRGPEEEKNKK